MTIFLTSYERIPKNNEIAFKSISVAFIKNMGNNNSDNKIKIRGRKK